MEALGDAVVAREAPHAGNFLGPEPMIRTGIAAMTAATLDLLPKG